MTFLEYLENINDIEIKTQLLDLFKNNHLNETLCEIHNFINQENSSSNFLKCFKNILKTEYRGNLQSLK